MRFEERFFVDRNELVDTLDALPIDLGIGILQRPRDSFVRNPIRIEEATEPGRVGVGLQLLCGRGGFGRGHVFFFDR